MKESALYQELFDQYKVCIIIPTYNNCNTLKQVIDSTSFYTSNIIVVNDGSTDKTVEILNQYPGIFKVSYPENIGKGWAIRKGCELAIHKGFEYIITIDSDGQHFASDLPKFIDNITRYPGSIVIGARNMVQDGIPGKSSFGNKFSNFWFWVETGLKINDTQSGYRLYPVSLFKNIKFYSIKYEFEIEVLVRSAWENINITTVPVSVYYAPEETRVTHFRPFIDFSRISILNTVLVILAWFYFRPRNFIRKLSRKETLRNLAVQLYNPKDSIWVKTFSVAFGVFMGIVPIWGFQLVAAILLAVLFRMNKALVVIFANISIPPMIPLIVYLSYQMGKFWMPAKSVNLKWDDSISLESIKINFIQYVFGAVSLAILAFIVSGLLTYIILSMINRSKIKILS